MKRALLSSLFIVLALLPACSTEKSVGTDGEGNDLADAAGNYSISLTAGANGCKFDAWTEGGTTTGITLTVYQADHQITAPVGGLAWLSLASVVGSGDFKGRIDGRHLDLTIYGTATKTLGNCTYTFNANVSAEVDGDFMQGSLRLVPAVNGNSDCAQVTCVSEQAFNGSRPPKLSGDAAASILDASSSSD